MPGILHSATLATVGSVRSTWVSCAVQCLQQRQDVLSATKATTVFVGECVAGRAVPVYGTEGRAAVSGGSFIYYLAGINLFCFFYSSCPLFIKSVSAHPHVTLLTLAKFRESRLNESHNLCKGMGENISLSRECCVRFC